MCLLFTCLFIKAGKNTTHRRYWGYRNASVMCKLANITKVFVKYLTWIMKTTRSEDECFYWHLSVYVFLSPNWWKCNGCEWGVIKFIYFFELESFLVSHVSFMKTDTRGWFYYLQEIFSVKLFFGFFNY